MVWNFELFIYCWFCSGFFQNGGKVNIYFGPMKFGLGLTLLGLGFGFLAYGVWVLMPTQLLESVCFG
jgi:POT family proton-dependent oligopeptide transporter